MHVLEQFHQNSARAHCEREPELRISLDADNDFGHNLRGHLLDQKAVRQRGHTRHGTAHAFGVLYVELHTADLGFMGQLRRHRFDHYRVAQAIGDTSGLCSADHHAARYRQAESR